MTPRYSMYIQWSNPDDAYLVTFPELTGVNRPQTHGTTYEDAAKNGREVLELLIEAFQEGGRPLPEPALSTYSEEA